MMSRRDAKVSLPDRLGLGNRPRPASFCPLLSLMTKAASSSSTDHGGAKRRYSPSLIVPPATAPDSRARHDRCAPWWVGGLGSAVCSSRLDLLVCNGTTALAAAPSQRALDGSHEEARRPLTSASNSLTPPIRRKTASVALTTHLAPLKNVARML